MSDSAPSESSGSQPTATAPGVRALTPPQVATLRTELLALFDTRARAMPWRETTDPYAIWVSEIMLQQTRVDTVIPYYRRWLERFPTVEALADAPEEEVLKRWEGLGYYSRARNLQRAARVVREEHAGRVPESVEELRALPGIGPYTAGAVASIAFGRVAPAVDGNVRRVAARLLDWPDPSPAELERTVSVWVDPIRPGDFNQALMELGATVCTPRTPACESCPVSRLCGARAAGTVSERPVPKKRANVRRETRDVTVAARRARGRWELALRKRPPEGLLAGLFEFPSVVRDAGASGAGAGTLWDGRAAHPLPAVRHQFTHLHVTYEPALVTEPATLPEDASWFTLQELEGLPLPVAQQSIVQHALDALAQLDAGPDAHRQHDVDGGGGLPSGG